MELAFAGNRLSLSMIRTRCFARTDLLQKSRRRPHYNTNRSFKLRLRSPTVGD